MDRRRHAAVASLAFLFGPRSAAGAATWAARSPLAVSAIAVLLGVSTAHGAPLASWVGSCESGRVYYVEVRPGTDSAHTERVMGEIRLDGSRAPARVVIHERRGRAGAVDVRMADGSTWQMTPVEFQGRWRSPCGLLSG
jgi:hypothetical protein